MAVKYAVANGNWNAGATWNDGVVPTADDDVYANNHTITLNVTPISVKSLSNGEDTQLGINGGGTFSRSGNITIDGNISQDNETSSTLSVTNGTLTLNGDVMTKTYQKSALNLSNNNTISLIVNGNITGIDYNTLAIIISAGSAIAKQMLINGNISNCRITTGNAFAYAVGTIYIVGNLTNVGIWDTSNGSKIMDIQISGNVSCENVNLYNSSAPQLRNLMIGGITTLINSHVATSSFVCLNDIFFNDDTGFGVRAGEITCSNPNAQWRFVGDYSTKNNPFLIINQNTIAQTYPTEDKVLAPTQYGAQMELVGQYTPNYPPESVVLKDYEYGDEDDPKTGTMVQEVNVEVGCVTPEDVRKDVPLVGMGVVGSLVVPSVDDVREGVIFDNGSVGTLIVQGGGERLRIADFSYYTNAQSDTYIVDLTEQDKPKFAVAEERVLIEMFPDLDLNNIPDKYFDDLFVKYLKYRLIVEYYRTAGINSTFTPSEPTTEIVNYQNVRNEVWLNSANIYLKAWAKKYPESIVRPQRILL